MDYMIKIDNSAWGTGVGTAQNKPCNVVIRDLLLYGNREAGYTGNGILLKVAGGVVLDGLGIFNFAGKGIDINMSKVIIIKNCSIGGSTTAQLHTADAIGTDWFPNDYGIYMDGVGAHVIIDKCVIGHNAKDGIYITNVADLSEDIWIHSTGIYWNDGAGIKLERKTTKAFWFIHIVDSIVDENIDHGLQIINNYSSGWGLALIIVGSQFIANGRGNTAKVRALHGLTNRLLYSRYKYHRLNILRPR
jgi:hypothetical protein